MLTIIEPCGYFYVHQACATWSKGVTTSSVGYSLSGVDVALIRAIAIRCQICTTFGASLTCLISSGCMKSYHFPCAVSCGAFFNIKTFSFHCTDHLHQGSILAGCEAQCVVCCSPGNVPNLVSIALVIFN